MGVAYATEYEYARTRLLVDYTIKCGKKQFIERGKYVNIKR